MNEIIKTFITNEIFSSNVYVIKWKNWWIIIDPWFYNSEIQDYLKKIWWVESILLTHGHWDHIRFVDEIKNDYPSAKIYIHEKDKELLTNINLNCSLLVWRKEIIIKSKVEFFDECNMEIWWYTIRIIHLPWHTDWCSMFYIEELNSLFLGDVVMEDSVWTLRTPTWDYNKMNASLWKFKHLWLDSNTKCYPGHWEMRIYWKILKENQFLRDYIL